MTIQDGRSGSINISYNLRIFRGSVVHVSSLLSNIQWRYVLQAVTVLGGLVGGMAALLEYSAHNKQEERNTILNLAEFALQSDGTKQLHDNISNLISLFLDGPYKNFTIERNADCVQEEYCIYDVQEDIAKHNYEKVRDYIEKKILPSQELKFDQIVSYFETIENIEEKIPCAWYVLSPAYRADADEFSTYFGIEFDAYAHKKNRANLQPIWDIAYEVQPKKVIPSCDAIQSGGLLHNFLGELKDLW
jgi:hypothetical protein